ncbi:MAG: NusG domain II-containing protein [Clostridia bacterium]|nr:NusG domain II-containing protein [Clostridia bacterium]
MRRIPVQRRLALLAAFMAACALLSGCRKAAAPAAPVEVRLDGEAWTGASVTPDSADDLRVYVTMDGAPLIDLPFDEVHDIVVTQPDGEENRIVLTGDAVYMGSANCENQDCVEMGAVTRENLELRVLGGFIVCLPHRLSVEVRGD